MATPPGGTSPLTSPKRACGSAIAGVRAIMATSRLHTLHVEKQSEADRLMEEFGEAVSRQAPEAEVQQLSLKLEKVQADAATLAEMRRSVDEKQAAADRALETFGRAVDTHAPEDEQKELSDKVESARLAVEREEAEQLKQFEMQNEVTLKLEKARLKAEKAEAAMRAQAEKKPVLLRRPSVERQTIVERRPSVERRANNVVMKRCERPSPRDHPSPRRPAPNRNAQPCATHDAVRNVCVPTQGIRNARDAVRNACVPTHGSRNARILR